MTLGLFGPVPATEIEGVPDRDRWRTPAGVVQAPLELLGAEGYDLDAAAEEAYRHAPRHIGAERNALTTPWGPSCPGWHQDLVDREAGALPLVWLNPPFSQACGGKARWIARAVEQAHTGLAVCLYLPVYADDEIGRLIAQGACTIVIQGRVKHIPPPGVEDGHPDRVAHAITLLLPPVAHGLWLARRRPQLRVWDWRRRAWVRPTLF